MFERLADPSPPTGDREAVVRRARELRSRRRLAWTGAATAVAAVVVAAVALTGGSGEGVDAVDVPVVTTTSASPGPIDAGTATIRCFAGFEGSEPAPYPAGTQLPVDGWPAGAPPVLVVTGGGNLWVVADGVSTLWTNDTGVGDAAGGVRWAQWAPDGSIYASRLIDSPEVVIEQFTAPGVAHEAFTLPFTVDQAAAAAQPDGCPINGYMDTFAVGSAGFALVTHAADAAGETWGIERRPYGQGGLPQWSMSSHSTTIGGADATAATVLLRGATSSELLTPPATDCFSACAVPPTAAIAPDGVVVDPADLGVDLRLPTTASAGWLAGVDPSGWGLVLISRADGTAVHVGGFDRVSILALDAD